MANRFVPNPVGYREVMNGSEMYTVCDLKGHQLAASAARQSGTDYLVDTMHGLNRIHTRVSTQGVRDYMRERHYNALAIAAGGGGGSLQGAVRRVSGSANKGWKALAGNRLAYSVRKANRRKGR